MCSNATVRIGKCLSDSLLIDSGLKEGGALSCLSSNYTLVYPISKLCHNKLGLKLKGTYQLLVNNYNLNLLG
jgi:hypothetical protein